MSESEAFIKKIKQVPNRILRSKVFGLGSLILVETKDITDYLALAYKDMPEALRYARKNGMRASFQSLKMLENLDKLFISKTFLNSMGLAYISQKKLKELVDEICATIKSDEEKIKTIMESRGK